MSGHEQTDRPVDHEDMNRAARWLKRGGYAARGFVYLVVGILTSDVMVSSLGSGTGGGADAGPGGAIAAIARQPLGPVLLIALAIGLVGYALYVGARATTLARDGVSVLRRMGLGIAALFYLGLAVLAAATALGGGGGSSDDPSRATAVILGLPGGRFLVGAVGLTFLFAAGYLVYRAFQDRFIDRLEREDMPAWLLTAVDKVGTAGLVTRGLAVALVGWFILLAAIQFQPEEAKGLDGALQAVAQEPYGPWVLALAALGFLAYAFLSFIAARYEQVGGDD